MDTVSAVRHDSANAHTIVSHSRRSTSESPDDTCGKKQVVSTIRTLPIVE